MTVQPHVTIGDCAATHVRSITGDTDTYDTVEIDDDEGTEDGAQARREVRRIEGPSVDLTVRVPASPSIDPYVYHAVEPDPASLESEAQAEADVSSAPAAKRQKSNHRAMTAEMASDNGTSEKERKKAEKAAEKEKQKAEKAAAREAAKEAARIAKASMSECQKRANGIFALSEITLHIDPTFLEARGSALA